MLCEFSGQPSQSDGKRKCIVLICLTLCLQLTELHMRNKFHPKNILSANQLFSLIDMERKFINSDNHINSININKQLPFILTELEPSWSYGSWIYNYLCNRAYHHLSCEFEPHSWRGLLDKTLCDKVCQWLATGLWISLGTPISATKVVAEILLKVVLITMAITPLNPNF